MRNFKTLFLLLTLLLVPLMGWAADLHTAKSGDWSATIWSGSRTFKNAYRGTGNVFIDHDVTISKANVYEINGNLVIKKGVTLTIQGDNNKAGVVVNTGNLEINGTLKCAPRSNAGSVTVYDGQVIVNGTFNTKGDLTFEEVTVNGSISGPVGSLYAKNTTLSNGSYDVKNLYLNDGGYMFVENSNVACDYTLNLMGDAYLNLDDNSRLAVQDVTRGAGARIQGRVSYSVWDGDYITIPCGADYLAYVEVISSGDGEIVVNYKGERPAFGAKKGVIFDQYWEFENNTEGSIQIHQLSSGCVPAAQAEFASLYEFNGNSWSEVSKDFINVNKDLSVGASVSLALGLNADLFGSGDGKIATSPTDVDYFDIESQYVSGEFCWTGEFSDDWDDDNNWVGGFAPDIYSDVTIGPKYSTSSSAVIDVVSTSGNEEKIVIGGEGQMLEVSVFPVIYNNSFANSVVITDGGSLTIDNARLDVSEALNVFDVNGNPSSKVGAVVVNNYYDASSSLRYASTNYSKFTVNRSFLSGIAYYVGSATKEGNISLRSASQATVADDGKKYADEMETFNASTGKYVSASKFDSYYGAAVWTPYTPSEDERVLSQVGTPYNGKVTLSLLDKPDTRVLLSNPYLMPIDLQAELTSGAISIDRCVEPTFVFRSFDLNSGEYYYNCVNPQNGVCVASASVKGSVAAKNAVLAPQQGFFAFTSVEGEYIPGKCNIILNNTKFTSETFGSEAALKDAKVKETDVLRLEVSNSDKNVDEVALVFRKGGSLEKNPVDSRKSLSEGMAPKDCNSIYVIKNDGLEASIPFLPETVEAAGNPIALGVNATTEASTLTISATNIDLFDEDYGVFLQDASANKSINLRLVPSYSFQAEAGEVIKDRFSILLVAPGTTAIANDPMESVNVAASADGLIVAVPAAAGASTVKVYDLAGRLVLSQSVAAGKSVVAAPAVKGVYVVEVVSSLGSKSIKINL